MAVELASAACAEVDDRRVVTALFGRLCVYSAMRRLPRPRPSRGRRGVPGPSAVGPTRAFPSQSPARPGGQLQSIWVRATVGNLAPISTTPRAICYSEPRDGAPTSPALAASRRARLTASAPHVRHLDFPASTWVSRTVSSILEFASSTHATRTLRRPEGTQTAPGAVDAHSERVRPLSRLASVASRPSGQCRSGRAASRARRRSSSPAGRGPGSQGRAAGPWSPAASRVRSGPTAR